MDDILLFCDGSMGALSQMKSIPDLFLKATRMSIIAHKSSITCNGLSMVEINKSLSLFPFEVNPLSDRLN